MVSFVGYPDARISTAHGYCSGVAGRESEGGHRLDWLHYAPLAPETSETGWSGRVAEWELRINTPAPIRMQKRRSGLLLVAGECLGQVLRGQPASVQHDGSMHAKVWTQDSRLSSHARNSQHAGWEVGWRVCMSWIKVDILSARGRISPCGSFARTGTSTQGRSVRDDCADPSRRPCPLPLSLPLLPHSHPHSPLLFSFGHLNVKMNMNMP